MDKAKQIEGYFIEFDSKEMESVKQELERLEYTPDGAGLKDLLLDTLFGEEIIEPEISDTERIIRNAKKFVEENPATVQFGLKTVKGLMGMMGKARR
jgi:hypothetical protein